jgi:hypothetical protein
MVVKYRKINHDFSWYSRTFALKLMYMIAVDAKKMSRENGHETNPREKTSPASRGDTG